ncbi:nickel pincer cofactor biosynthesis protein LarC [Thioalkalivibrio sp. XN8]|uniref:nickel pincer cofactor biosynthesis protein LarC n=1 Tax=Thioalkalivibrio sp. XN8 TaxID=2712863 RepID=UPI0013EA4F87|nr:nickel pincer cofactor biosynthesis protein LarC [Thioalkalivibrio sp. XN8]NGP53700.1 nickel pincer cofactor biosynthesis protein LarC [Thioalkalivibrio sp. XN8]
MRSLLVEAHAGISGDMFVAAAAALADCEAEVVALPGLLGLEHVHCRFSEVIRGSLACRKFDVDDHKPRRDSHHRPLALILDMIERAALEEGIRVRASKMFTSLAMAESQLHGMPIADVQFHEIGAVDSIIDIVAAAVCIERLEVDAAFSTPICVGSGLVHTAHGQLPVPAPATEQLLHGMLVTPGDLPGEWTTPTGAAILRELGVSFDWPVHTVTASSYGGGSLDPASRANVLRLRLAQAHDGPGSILLRDEVFELRCNIDDCTAEMLGGGFVSDLLERGALDVVIFPVTMKKGRPGYVLEVLAGNEGAENLASYVLEHTSTIGIRLRQVPRLMLRRRRCKVHTPFGKVEVKVSMLPSGSERVNPEYESCRERARVAGVPIQEVYAAALRAERPENLGGSD